MLHFFLFSPPHPPFSGCLHITHTVMKVSELDAGRVPGKPSLLLKWKY
jgi:hypothetical protein